MVLHNAAYQAIARIATSGISFIIIVLIARQLGVAGYGDFTKVTAFVALFYLVLDFGLNAIFLQHEFSKTHFRDLLYGRVFLSVILMLFVNEVVWLLPYQINTVGFSYEVRIGIAIFSLTFLSQAMFLSSAAIFQRELRYNALLIASCIGSIVTLITTMVILSFTHSFVALLIPLLLGNFVSSSIALLLTKEKIFPFQMRKEPLKTLFFEAWPLGLMLLLNLVYFRVDMLLLSFLRPTTEVGIYGLAYRFFDFLIALPLFLSNALYPAMLSDQKKFQNNFKKAKIYVFSFFVLSLPLVAVFWPLAPLMSLIRIDYASSVLPFRILLLSLPLFFMTSVLQWFLIAKQQQKYLLCVYLFSAVVTVVLNALYIPVFSYVASAAITVIGEAVVLLLLLAKLLKE